MIDRRHFLVGAASMAVADVALSEVVSGADHVPGKTGAPLMIDALGSPGEFDPGASDDSPLSPGALRDAKASGLTAIHVTVGAVGNVPDAFEQSVAGIAMWERELAQHSDAFVKVRNTEDLRTAQRSGRLGLIYGFQDTSMLEGNLARIALFYNLGVRIIQVTYNRRNLMGDGCLEPADGGLSRLGRECIAELNRLRVLVDLSHAGARTIAEGIAASSAPVAITHTGCRALVDVPRNTHDRELKSLANRGGVAGIYFMPFLRERGQPRAEDLVRHLEHAINVCGEDHVGIGTDGAISGIRLDAAYAEYQRKFYEGRAKAGIAAPGEAADVFNLIPDYNEPRRFLKLADDLADRGWKSGRIEKVLGANFARLFSEVWPGS